jgi:hypothetical protein
VTLKKAAQGHKSFAAFMLIMTAVHTTLMELNINRTDFSALETIATVLKVYNNNFPNLDEGENALWAIAMIKHEVEQTGRTV